MGSSLFARRYWGNRFLFLFLEVLRCFSSLGCLHYSMCSSSGDGVLPPSGCPIRVSPDQCLLAAPRGVSSLATPFIGSFCQGIHHALFVAYPLQTRNSRSEFLRKRIPESASTNHFCSLLLSIQFSKCVRFLQRDIVAYPLMSVNETASNYVLRPYTTKKSYYFPCVREWALVGSNHRPRPYQGRALAS